VSAAPIPEEELRPADAPNLAPPPGNPRFPLIDSMRAIAALSVFAGHTVTGVYAVTAHPTLFLWAVQLSYEGVAIFFLISGFLLYRPFLTARRDGKSLRLVEYGKRRVLRIVPAYWVALTIFIAAGWVSGVTAGNWWIFYLFGQIYSPVNIGHGIGVAWTLCIEVTFYAALPVFVLLCARLARRRGSFRPDVVLIVLLAAGSLAFRAHSARSRRWRRSRRWPGHSSGLPWGWGWRSAASSSKAGPRWGGFRSGRRRGGRSRAGRWPCCCSYCSTRSSATPPRSASAGAWCSRMRSTG
jgi:peptidoglycan/LPS O-acetylase OafA/YrhL